MTSVKPPAPQEPAPSAATLGSARSPDLAVLGLLLAVLLLGLTGSLVLLARAAADPGRSGRFTALFPPGWSAEARLAALVAADVRPVRESWIPGAVELEGEAPAVAGRLRSTGALLVLPGLPSDLLAAGGCSGGSLADFPDRPALRKLKAGPL